ncbi:MAG: beta-glucosidase [Actinobacteria bacterium]|nr:beta-glucosidase [Actinomycetota bacterium]NBY15713.1 beta-glucosidase [Actinomycetota bacterium]
MKFPADFNWGVATSSYQIEGATSADGRGPSIWDTFCATPGKVVNAESGDVACDHYHRYPEDIAIMKELGVTSYRFSISWPRLFPNGDQVREERGFTFYNNLINELLANDIEPIVTLYHWDLPQALEDKGGWANREIVKSFADYATACAQAFGDRVTNWITLNEPWVFTWLGYLAGVHAPGRTELAASIAAAHHTSLAHAQGLRAIKSVNPDFKVGIALNMSNYRVTDESNPELRRVESLLDGHLNRWWLDAMYYGQYPSEVVAELGENLGRVFLPGDAELIQTQTDFIGVNYYSDNFISAPKPDQFTNKVSGHFPFVVNFDSSAPLPHTDMGWPITPTGLYDLLVRINRDWPMVTNIAITENGAAYPEEPDEDGIVFDERRVTYLETHLTAVADAIADGVPVASYFAWSLMDNFEWAEGYAKRFGLVHVDFKTLERTLKNSAKYYQDVIKQQRTHGNPALISLA